MDKMHMMLTELCSTYSLCTDFIVFEHIVVPTEFLIAHLEIRLSEYVEWGWEWYYFCPIKTGDEISCEILEVDLWDDGCMSYKNWTTI